MIYRYTDNLLSTFALVLYILKIKGTEKIPDFVQIRDEHMTLQAYFRLSQTEKGLIKNNLEEDAENIKKLLNEIPFGKIHKYTKE
tara:strand:- start:4222 stop:4476 length:255 start_codon:yes stop_codon:yes gene_type:complete